MKYNFNICFSLNVYELMSVKLGMLTFKVTI